MTGSNHAVDAVLTDLSPELAGVLHEPPPPVSVSPPSAADAREAVKQSEAAARAREPGGLVRKFGALARAVPGAERVRVHKRERNGVVGYVGEYSFRDIEHTGDLEAFLAKYVKPTYKGGEYLLRIVDGNGKEWDAGVVTLLDPAPEAQGDATMSMMREMMTRLQTPAAPAIDPLDQMRRAMTFAEEIKGKGGDGNMAMMMMMMQMQRPAAPATDPAMLSVLERLAAKVEKLETIATAPPALPPMAPAAAPMDIPALITAVTAALGTIITATRPVESSRRDDDDRLKPHELITMLDSARNAGASATQHHTDRLISLLENRHNSEKPQSTLEDQMESMRKLHEFVKSFAPPSGGNNGTTFWDALTALANNGDIASGIGSAIRERGAPQRVEVQTVQSRPAPAPQLAPPPQQRVLPPPPPWVPQPTVPVATAAPVAAVAAPQPAPVAAAEPVAEVVPTTAAAAPTNGGGAGVYIDGSFKPFCERLDDAAAQVADSPEAQSAIDGAIAQRTIEALIALYQSPGPPDGTPPQWPPFVRDLMSVIMSGQQEPAMRGLGGLLGLLAKNGWLRRESGLAALRVMQANWEIVRVGVSGIAPKIGVGPAPEPAPITTPAPEAPAAAPPSAPPAPAPVDVTDVPGLYDDPIATHA